jgi:hypothetical protein
VPPVQKGWKRSFVLREDVAKSDDADFYEGILAKINTTLWSYRKDFLKKKKIYGRKRYVVREQHLLRPDEYHFKKLNFSEAEKQQFYEEVLLLGRSKVWIKRYVFKEPWRFVLRVQPNIIDKVRKRDPDIDARLHEIDNYLERNAYRDILAHLVHGSTKRSYWKDYEKPQERNCFINKPIQRILDEIKSEL